MIRLEFAYSASGPRWAVISQLEHARVSGELATACRRDLLFDVVGEPLGADDSGLAAVRAEALAAVFHHDDGWAEWEQSPRVDPESGRPLNYTELSPAEAADIWTRSIDIARRFGPLAGATVAGHFLRLLKSAEHLCKNPVARAWGEAMTTRRDELLATWQAANFALHTPALAARALEWLWTFDETSLWLCGDRPPGSGGMKYESNYRAGHGTPLEMELREVVDEQVGVNGRPAATAASPWRFTPGALQFEIHGQVVTGRPASSGADLWKFAKPITFEQRLRPA